MADVDDDIPEVDGYSQEAEDLPPVAGFDEDVPQVDDSPGVTASAPTMGTGNKHLDNLLKWYSGMSEAATLNHAGEVGAVGSRIGTALADMLQPSRERDGMEPEYAGRRGVDPNELVDRSMESPIGKLGYATGVVAPAVASGGASAATLPTRVGVGAAQGALAAGGDSGHDPASMLTGGAAGGALAGLGGALGQRAGSPSGKVVQELDSMGMPVGASAAAVPTRAELAMKTLSGLAKKGTGQMGAGAAAGALLSGSKDPVDIAKSAAIGALGGKALGMAGAAAPKLAPMVAPALRATGTVAAPLFGSMASRPSKASAQADVAYGTAPTMAWAVESVLTSGDTGLDPKDEQQLTEAVMSGDEDRMIAANFSLSQRSPGYAAKLRRELESLQEE